MQEINISNIRTDMNKINTFLRYRYQTDQINLIVGQSDMIRLRSCYI